MKFKRGLLVLSALLVFGLAFGQVKRISLATGGTGGVYYPLGGGIAQVWTDYVDGVEASAEVTGASVENVRLVASGEAQAALGTSGVVVQAYKGEGKFKGKAQPILAIGAMYPNAWQFVTVAETGIKAIPDIKGKRVSTGAPGSGTAVMTQAILKTLGYVPGKDFKEFRLSFAEQVSALKDGTIDVGSWSVGLGPGSLVDLSTTRQMVLICMTPEEQAKVSAENPYYKPFTIPAGTYKGQDSDCLTVGTPNVLFVRADEDPELVYQLTKALFEHVDELGKIHPAGKTISPEYVLQATLIPLHPGAIKYFEEIGLTVPDRLKPAK